MKEYSLQEILKNRNSQQFSEFLKEWSSSEVFSPAHELLNVVKKGLNQMIQAKYEHNFSVSDKYIKDMEDLKYLKDYLENIVDKIHEEYEQAFNEDCLEVGKQYWKDLYSDDSNNDW